MKKLAILVFFCFTVSITSFSWCAHESAQPSAPKIDWDSLQFEVIPTDFIYRAECRLGEEWQEGKVIPYGEIQIASSAGILNYGQGIFEGMKAFRDEKGNIVLFRPEQNARRFRKGALRMGMPPVSEELYIKAVKQIVLANQAWIPPIGKGWLYIRPLLVGTGPVLNLQPAPSYTFLIFVTPVGNYFKTGVHPIDVFISDQFHRACDGGIGDVKAVGNYAATFVPLKEAEAQGYTEILYLDDTNTYVTELSSSNFFCVKDKVLYTPPLSKLILEGVTRDSIIKLATSLGYEVKQQPVTVDFALSADEAFCSGTAVVVAPIGTLTYKGKKIVLNNRKMGPVTQLFLERLSEIQNRQLPDEFGWVQEVH